MVFGHKRHKVLICASKTVSELAITEGRWGSQALPCKQSSSLQQPLSSALKVFVRLTQIIPDKHLYIKSASRASVSSMGSVPSGTWSWLEYLRTVAWLSGVSKSHPEPLKLYSFIVCLLPIPETLMDACGLGILMCSQVRGSSGVETEVASWPFPISCVTETKGKMEEIVVGS